MIRASYWLEGVRFRQPCKDRSKALTCCEVYLISKLSVGQVGNASFILCGFGTAHVLLVGLGPRLQPRSLTYCFFLTTHVLQADRARQGIDIQILSHLLSPCLATPYRAAGSLLAVHETETLGSNVNCMNSSAHLRPASKSSALYAPILGGATRASKGEERSCSLPKLSSGDPSQQLKA